MNTQSLFGGAILSPVPSSFVDASQFRQIPDNQEVFVDMNTQQSLIFELLEQVEAKHTDVAKFHFQQLADDNEATDATVSYVEQLDPKEVSPLLTSDATELYILQGTQKVSKFNEKQADNTVEIVMAVIRLIQVETDFVISINAPIQLANTSSEREYAQGTNPISIDVVKQEMLVALKGLEVKDWSLFG
ncbi:putative ran guanine nucleotide release factor [Choanephora cucurbitarum]|uniref:Putative ran guanine nucleotide release factor n=1 Tax=Choanephora cucurbitarum TaxID=101091 RepID=A0A1C7N3Z0_9FUNG|nr:putative ran guanine nucleotide release factor [Choanephora cucurbitarum]